MGNKETRLKFLDKIIGKNEVCSFKNLLQKVECSTITLRRDIKEIRAITSYTHKGHFLTLPHIPTFDENGIWFYDKIGFTKFKNSFDLIVTIINNSEKGISKEALDEILKIDVCKQIQILLKRNELNRVKIGNKYCYLSDALAKDRTQRLKLLDANEMEEYYDRKVKLTDLIALLKAVLLEGKIDMNNLKRLIRKYSLNISITKIEQLLLKYNLPEKKTPLTF